MSIIICSSLLLLLLLFPLQVFSARPLGVAVHNDKDPADEEKTLVHHLSYKNDNETTKIDVPSKEITPTSPARDQNETLEDTTTTNNNNKDQKAKSRITSSSGSKESKQPAATVSWKVPDHQKNKKRRKKKMRRGGSSHDPELTLDYAPPRVHPPCHN